MPASLREYFAVPGNLEVKKGCAGEVATGAVSLAVSPAPLVHVA
jgi:hypothetical protein